MYIIFALDLFSDNCIIVSLVSSYGISVSQMTTNMFHMSHALLPGPFLIHDLSLSCNWSNTVGTTIRIGTSYPSGAHGFIPIFNGFRVDRSLVFV
jgi:hypothetical protein